MNYYEEIEDKIKDSIKNEDYLEAYRLVKDELNAPYIPSDFKDKLIKYLNTIKPNIIVNKKEVSLDKIKEYLYKDPEYQLIAVSELFNKDLSSEIDLVNDYLKSDGYLNAKVLLVEELIRQGINQEIEMYNAGINYTFIPKYLLLPEETDGYLLADKIIQDKYFKDPSKYKLAKQLLYKEVLLLLPDNPIEDEGKILANKVIDYIEDAFK